jgi:hypothetical protein
MEYLVAVLLVVLTVGYAIFIAVNIEKGKPWAIEIARAASMMDPLSADRHLRYEVEPEVPAVREPQPVDRLAA